MSQFFKDDVIEQLHDMWGAWLAVDRWGASRYDFEEESCYECGDPVEDILHNGNSVVLDDGYDGWNVCYCEECFHNWAEYEDDFIPLFRPATDGSSSFCCDHCDEDLNDQHTWHAYDEDGCVYCHTCWLEWDGWSQEGDTDEDSDDTDVYCHECGWNCSLGDNPYVTHVIDERIQCLPCYHAEAEDQAAAQAREPPTRMARTGGGAANDDDAISKARNDRDKAKLRARYKDYCAYHLFHAHHRKHQGCSFAAAGQNRCSRGLHGIPDDFEDAQGELETPVRA